MKKLIIAALTLHLLSFYNISIAKTEHTEMLSRMENSLFGIEYSNQNETKRIERIEKAVYGESTKGNITNRISKISKDLNAEMFGQEIKPKKDTFDEEEDYIERKEKADANINYPIIDELEKKVFQQNYKKFAIEKRLENLEKKVFSKNYNNEDLNKRTERLKSALLPKKNNADDVINLAQDDIYDYNDYLSSSDEYEKSFKQNKNNQDFNATDNELNYPLTQLEKQILKRTYKNDEPSTRLVRLETKMFNSTFTQDDTQTRLDRISSAYQASKTSKKYDDNKFSQRMATAMQIGAFVLMILAAIL